MREIKRVDLKGGVVLEGLPGPGWVGTISSACLISQLKLELVGTLESEFFPSLAMVYDSEPNAPARIYADERKRLSVFIAEFPIPPNLERPLAETVFKWARDNGSSLIVTSTGLTLEREEQEPKNMEVLGVGNTSKARSLLDEVGIRRLDSGSVLGIPGILLVEGRRKGLDVIALLVSSQIDAPDHRAGAKIGEAIGRLVPQAKCDVGPLLIEARRAETRLKDVSTRIRHPSEEMYG